MPVNSSYFATFLLKLPNYKNINKNFKKDRNNVRFKPNTLRPLVETLPN